MNALVLKWLTLSIVGLVVCSAIWLAGSVKLHPSAPSYRLASLSSSAETSLSTVEQVLLPADFAASATLRGSLAVR